jgi:DNA-binding NarL/FixJ family response regulator
MAVKPRAAIVHSHDFNRAALRRRLTFSGNVEVVSEARRAHDLLVFPEVADADLVLFVLSLSDSASEAAVGCVRSLVSRDTPVLVASPLAAVSIKETVLGALRAGAGEFYPLQPDCGDDDPGLVEAVGRLVAGRTQASSEISFLLFAEDRKNPRRELTDHERQALYYHGVGFSQGKMAREMDVDAGYAVECLERAHAKLLHACSLRPLPGTPGRSREAAGDRTASAPASNREAVGRRDEVRRHSPQRCRPRPQLARYGHHRLA